MREWHTNDGGEATPFLLLVQGSIHTSATILGGVLFFVLNYFAKVFCHLTSKTGISSTSITQPNMQFPTGFVAAARGFEQARANTTFQQTIKGGITELKISSPPNRNAAKTSL